jgi:hypothetical protein
MHARLGGRLAAISPRLPFLAASMLAACMKPTPANANLIRMIALVSPNRLWEITIIDMLDIWFGQAWVSSTRFC